MPHDDRWVGSVVSSFQQSQVFPLSLSLKRKRHLGEVQFIENVRAGMVGMTKAGPLPVLSMVARRQHGRTINGGIFRAIEKRQGALWDQRT
jgi:hypothetical protein